MAASMDKKPEGSAIPGSSEAGSRGQFLEPLTFDVGSLGSAAGSPPSTFAVGSPPALATPDKSLMKCIFCDVHFNGSVQFKDDYLRHLLQQHKFVIGDFKTVPDFRRYIEYWRQRFRGRPKTDFCSVIRTNTGENDSEASEDYFLLCDALPEDKDVRNKLQVQKLQDVLEQQQRERNETNFNFGCLFCKERFTTNRADLFNHMNTAHNFNVGHPDNLVYTDEFLTVLHGKVDGLVCFYCEKTFKDRFVLKEHMRKKQHKQINPKDKFYDKYYIINYLEIGKTWEDIQSEDDGEMRPHSDSDSEWEDWMEDEESAVCLYCTVTGAAHHVIAHMRDVHEFDLRKTRSALNLTFYQQIKLVNYIRRQVYQNTCPECEVRYESREELTDHMTESGHIASAPRSELWDQPEYFFPTYENDRLLCCLEEDPEEKAQCASATVVESIEEVTDAVVIPEDLNIEEAMGRRDYIMKELRS